MYEGLLDILSREGYIHLKGSIIETQEHVEKASDYIDGIFSDNTRESLLNSFRELEAYAQLLLTCLQSYPEILSGKVSHMEIMFPGGSKSLVEKIYQGDTLSDYYNRLTAQVIKSVVEYRLQKETHRQITILEIGAGTGGTTTFVLEALKPYSKYLRYIYSDISKGFVQHGKDHYAQLYPFLDFSVLDIQQSPLEQGFQMDSIDIIMASNAIHATERMGMTLNHIKWILKKHGIVVLNEITQRNDLSTLIFGLTSGWWAFKDDHSRIKGSPLLSEINWENVLKDNGFSSIKQLGFLQETDGIGSQHVITAQSDGVVLFNEPHSNFIVEKNTLMQTNKKDLKDHQHHPLHYQPKQFSQSLIGW